VRETALRNIAALAEKGVEGLALVSASAAGITTTFTWRGELYLDRFTAQPMDEMLEGDEQRKQKFFDRVVQQVYQSIDLLSRTHPFIVLERVLVAPGPPGLYLMPALAAKLNIPVQFLDLGTLFDFKGAPQLAKPEMQYRYLVALGAALRGMKATS
jgi:Tfp pilus assembly PilM family ATPase